MGSRAADNSGKNNEMIKKYPIIAVNGCDGGCVNQILENKCIDVAETLGVGDVLANYDVSNDDPFRLDDEGEKCVKIIKEKLKVIIKEI